MIIFSYLDNLDGRDIAFNNSPISAFLGFVGSRLIIKWEVYGIYNLSLLFL